VPSCRQAHGRWAKEVHFFNRWPLPKPPKREFLRCFPVQTWNIAKHEDPRNFTLVDATPDYMFNGMAAPRIKAMWPQAKFLVLLRVRPSHSTTPASETVAETVAEQRCRCCTARNESQHLRFASQQATRHGFMHTCHPDGSPTLLQDPIARTYSAWAMSKKMACRKQTRKNAFAPCNFPAFAEMVVNEVKILKRQGCTFSRAVCSLPLDVSTRCIHSVYPCVSTCVYVSRLHVSTCLE
jgi:hypothetical protein